MDAEKAAQEAEQDKMRKEFEEQMAKMKAEVQAKKDDEAAKAEAEEAERKMRIDMEFKLEQEKLRLAQEEADRQERIRKEEAAIKKRQEENARLDK